MPSICYREGHCLCLPAPGVIIMQKKMATHFSILAWEILWTEEPGRLQFMGLQELDTT